MRLLMVILTTLLISLTACTKPEIKYVKSPPEIITQKEYITDNVSVPRFDNCSVTSGNVKFKATSVDNTTIYFLDTYNALKLINLETNRVSCLEKYERYTNMLCSLSSIVCE